MTWVTHEPHVVNAMGLRPLLLHDVNVQEKRGAGAVVGFFRGCDWVMKTGWLWARVARADGGWVRLLVLEVVVIVLAQMAPVRMAILIAKRTSLLLDGSRRAQCHNGLTKKLDNIQSR